MKVAIWGSYNHGNFGDDVMAVLFSEVLAAKGAQPIAFRLDSAISSRYRIRTVNSLDELFRGAAFAIIGGGMMLGEASAIRRVLRPYARSFERDFFELRSACRRSGLTVFPISIGGDGEDDLSRLSRERLAFFKSSHCGPATVRLPSDVKLLEVLGKQATYYPDVLLSIANRWQLRREDGRDDRFHLGVNLNRRTGARLMRALLELTLRHKRLVLHFIRSHLVDAAASYEIMPTAFGESVQLHRYRDPKETAAFLGSLDAIVSSKLHLGVVALSYGVPFLSFSGKGKTRAFMRSIGAEHAVFAVAQERSVVRTLEDMLVGRMSPKALIGSASVAARESLGHLERLENLTTKVP